MTFLVLALVLAFCAALMFAPTGEVAPAPVATATEPEDFDGFWVV